MQALELLYQYQQADEIAGGYMSKPLEEAIKELEALKKEKEKDLLEEYVQFSRLHIETYRCKCGALGRVGYLCSNKECSERN